MLIVPIFGFPYAGKRTLAAQLCDTLPDTRVIAFEQISAALKEPSSAATHTAQRLSASGQLIPDDTFGTILGELVLRGSSHVSILPGLPRNLPQLQALQRVATFDLFALCLEASPELIDQRRMGLGLPPIEQSHPQALARLRAQLEPMIRTFANLNALFVLPAHDEPARVAAAARARLTLVLARP